MVAAYACESLAQADQICCKWTHEAFLPGALAPRTPRTIVRDGVVLHKDPEIGTVVDRLERGAQTRTWCKLVMPTRATRGRLRTILDAHRRKRRAVIEDRALEEERVATEMVLQALVDLVGTFFESTLR